jgi:hypothetical protein
LPIVAGIARALKSPGVLVLIAALVGASFVSRGCQRSQVRLNADQSVLVGERAIDFEPEGHAVRMVLRGVPPKRYWGVSYWIRNPTGKGYRKLTVVLVDANTGKVDKVYVKRP